MILYFINWKASFIIFEMIEIFNSKWILNEWIVDKVSTFQEKKKNKFENIYDSIIPKKYDLWII
jgi:hypothetical protein